MLAETDTEIDPTRREHLRRKLTQAIDSRAGYPVEFSPGTSSPVPGRIEQFTVKTLEPQEFVTLSQELARHLFELQDGSVSPGLLAVLDVVSRKKPGLVLMKLEREAGAQLELEIKDVKIDKEHPKSTIP